jgi:outer membrane protein OmpU
MNKLKKIGVTALAGALVSFSANAADWNVSGSAGLTLSNTNETSGVSSFSQDDNIVITAAGQTENGIDVSASFKIEAGADGTGGGFDERSFTVGTAEIGSLTYHGHGGSVVMGQFDDVTPKAYEEVWDVGTNADVRINGVGEEDNIFTYVSPSFQGVTLYAAHATEASVDNTAADVGNDSSKTVSNYTDFGIKISPEMVEGLSVYYAQGERDLSATQSVDENTWAITYAYGPVTVGYQESEADKSGVSTDNELESMSIAYAVTDDLTISYGEREFDHDTSASSGDEKLTQKDSGFGISYTMGGVSIGGSFNTHDNVTGGNTTADDFDSYEMNLSFAF